MIKRDNLFYIIIPFILLLVCIFSAGCKDNSTETVEGGKKPSKKPIEVTAEVDRSEVFAGAEITYTLTVNAIPEIQPEIPEMGASIMGLRIVDMGEEGPRDVDGRRIWKRWYRLKADFTGSYIIPQAEVIYKDPAGKETKVASSKIFIEVKTGKEEKEEASDILDIKPLQNKKVDLTPICLWSSLAILVFMLAAFFIWLFIRKRRTEKIEAIPSPDETALMALDMLKTAPYLAQEDFRTFYFSLSEIFRAYMEKMFHFPAQESTTEELIPRIEKLDLTRAQKDLIRFLSRGEDLVKFARHRPTLDKADKDWNDTRQFILQTKTVKDTEGEKIP